MNPVLEIRAFLTALFVALLCISGINVYVDPSHHWHRSSFFFLSSWKPDQVLLPPDHFDDRLFRRDHLQRIAPPGIVFFGSSRVRKVSQALFIPTLRLYNAGVGLAAIEDDVSLWQELRNLHKVPPYAVVFVDPWSFNTYPSLGIWKSNLDLYEQFLRRQAAHKRQWASWLDWAATFGHRLSFEWTRWTDLFSWETFRTSCQLMARGDVTRQSLFSTKDSPEARERQSIRPDGSWSDGAYELARATSDQVDTSMPLLESRYLNGWTPNVRRLTLFKDLLEDFHRSHVAVLIVDPPLHPVAYRYIQDHPSARKAVQSHLQTLAAMIDKADLCEALDPRQSGCDASEFVDTQHMTPSCVQKVIRRCFKERGWGELLQQN